MTTAHVEKFAELLVKDPALMARLMKHKENMDVYASAAVQEGKALGLIFTADEFSAFVMAERTTGKEGALIDFEIDAVSAGLSSKKMVAL